MLWVSTLSRKKNKLLKPPLILASFGVVFFSLFFGLSTGDTAHAAYPNGYCTFKSSSDDKTITAKCNDDASNGTLDGAVYQSTGGVTYSLTQKGARGLKCTSKIAINNKKAEISGSYLTYTLSTAADTHKCQDIATDTIDLDRGSSRNNAYFNKVVASLAPIIGKKCDSIPGAPDRQVCQTNTKNIINACVASSRLTSGITTLLTGDSRNAFKSALKKCLQDNISGVSASFIGKTVDDADKAGANEAATIEDSEAGDAAIDENTTNCAIDGIGWIICPVMTFMANVVDGTYNVVESLLGVQPLTTNTSKSALYSVWSIMRNFANICFVIAFLVLIYSQVTGVGLSNYGIKKMLPKLFIAAVLVNTSYWICAIAVDLSNIAGSSVKQLFDSFGGNIEAPNFGNTATGEAGWLGIVGPVLAGALVGVGIYLAIGSILIALPAALLAILTVFLVLTLRQAIIIVLIAVSPLAFVAYLLPNTEEWFKRWRGLFQTMLLMFPIIAAIFGGSQLASKVIMSSATDANGDGIFAVQVMGALVAILPLAITPIVMKTAGGVLNRFAGIVNNPNKGPFDRMRKRAEATAERIGSNRDRRALNSTNPLRNVPMLSRRRGMIGQMKREARKQERDATYETVANSDRGTSILGRPNGAADYRATAIGAQETASKTKQILENETKLDHLNNNHALHGRAEETGLDLHNAEDTHKNEVGAQHMAANPNQYDDLNEAKGEKKSAELETQRRFEGSGIGRQQSEDHQDLEDRTAIIKDEQQQAYKTSGVGMTNAQGKQVSGAAVKLADSGNELSYKQSQPGQDQAQEMKEVQGDISNIDIVHDTSYKTSPEGEVREQRKRIVQKDNSIADTEADIQYSVSSTGERQAVQEAVGKDQLGAVTADTEAIIEELRTDEGPAAHPQYAQSAADLTQADVESRVQRQRKSSAAGVATREYAEKVADDSTGLAAKAGGVDQYGAQRARATATQTMIDEFNKNVKSEQSTMSKYRPNESGPNGEASLRDIALDSTQSTERRAAAAGMYMKSAPMQDLHSFVDAVGSLPDEQANKRADMLMQISEDMNRVPFAYSDGAKAAIRRGDFTTRPPDQGGYGTHEDQLVTRVQRKMSGAEWQSMDPDDRRAIRLLSSTPQGRARLGTVGMGNLQSAFTDINATPDIRTRTKTDARQEANRVAASFGFQAPFPDTETPNI